MGAADSPKTHRWSRWVNAWTALSLPGLCVAVLVLDPGTVLGIAATVSLPLTLALASLGGRVPGEGRPTKKVSGGWIGRVVLCAVTLVLSTAAICAVVPGIALLILLLAGATSPPASDLRRRLLGQADPANAPAATAGPISPPGPSPSPRWRADAARTMTDGELCRAWRRSFWTLKETRNLAVKLTIVEQRQCFLDELEARNAVALEEWLASGARACGSPERFFNTDGGDQPTAA